MISADGQREEYETKPCKVHCVPSQATHIFCLCFCSILRTIVRDLIEASVLHVIEHRHASAGEVEEIVDVHVVETALLIELIGVHGVLQQNNGVGGLGKQSIALHTP